MKTFPKLLLCISLILCYASAEAQVFDKLFKKKEKTETEATQPKEEQPKEQSPTPKKEEAIKADEKKFTFRCFTLNADIAKADIQACAEKEGEQMITEMQYYEQGEDVRMRDKTNAAVSLQFKDDTPRLITINVEDIEDVSVVNQLQQLVLTQMGTPTMGYELMKNYDGPSNTALTDYTTYEYMYRYIIGLNVYDFQVTQFGAKVKNGKVIHPYTFSATVNKKSDVALKVSNNLGDDSSTDAGDTDASKKKDKEKKKELSDDEKLKKNFYPTVGVTQTSDCTIEARMLRKW
jgi:hypothetical protein